MTALSLLTPPFLFPLFFTERATSQSLFICQTCCEEQLGKPSIHLHLSSAGSREDGKTRKPQLKAEKKKKDKTKKEEKEQGGGRESMLWQFRLV